jgi:hypothetical protein
VGNQNQTERAKFEARKGKEVAVDYFLYSCLETERTTKQFIEEGGKEISWPELANQKSGELTGTLADSKLKDLLREMTMWYRDNHPEMSASLPLDHEQLLKVSPGLTALNKNFTTLYQLKTGDAIPTFEASVGNNMIWEDIDEVVGIFFESYKHLFIRYIIWSHGASPDEAFVPGSRPPIGKYAPRLPRNNDRDRGGNSRGGNQRNDRGPRNGNAKNDRGPKGNSRNDRPRPGAANKKNDRGPRGSNRNDRPRPQRSAEETAKIEASALKDVTAAIGQLNGEKAKDEVILKPANSFYRRLQHQKAVELGFDSFSVGEGKDRAVRIARKEGE